ncbi:unknown [Clostridium sp. CAG:448]|nr:unknown [Clostridium sp. CAG:448]
MRRERRQSTAGGSGVCCALLGSMTQALRAQSVLHNASVCVHIVKVNDAPGIRGCIYGITYPCSDENQLRSVLTQEHVAVRQYAGGWDG